MATDKIKIGLAAEPLVRPLPAPMELVDEEEAMMIGSDPRPTGPIILTPEESRRLLDLIRPERPVVLTERMLQAIENYKRIMGESAD